MAGNTWGMFLAIFVAMAAPCAAPAAPAKDGFTIQDVEDAWRNRGRRIKSVMCSLKESRTIAKGSLPGLRRRFQKAAEPMPQKDVSFELTHDLAADGPKMHYRRNGKYWSITEGKLKEELYVSVCDGQNAKVYRPNGIGGAPRATTAQASCIPDTSLVSILPIILICRAATPGVSLPFRLSDFETTRERGIINGRECAALRQKARSSMPGVMTLWVDPERDFRVARYTTGVDGRVIFQLDIAYEGNGQDDSRPLSWRYVFYQSGGSFRESGEIRVSQFTINVPIDSGMFDVAIPVGAIVNDLTPKGTQAYIIKRDGERRVITNEDSGKAYEEVINEGDAMGTTVGRKLVLVIMGLAIALLIVAAWKAFKIRLRGR